ncbi:MAG: hypothetical protein ABIJ26_06215, partial [Candidatus Margulisiibacteriota bacterium]
MDDIKLKLSELENQVSIIKDASLRKIAFEKLLERGFYVENTKKTLPKADRTKVHGKKKQASNSYYSEAKI